MSKTVSGSRSFFPIRLLTVNYIGGLGYYCLLVAAAVWAVELFTHLRQYIVYEVVHAVPDVLTTHSANGLTTNADDVSKIFVEVFSVIVVVICILIVVTLPYYIGLYASRLSNYLLYMTGRTQSVAHLASLKQIIGMVWIATFIVTTYDFSQDADSNGYSIGLIVAVVAGMVLFWLQHLLAKWWNLQEQHIF